MGKELVREHKHVIVRAYVNNPPSSKEQLSEWCKNVISDVGMKVIGGPLVVYSEMEGNKGYTAVAILDFSHLSIHTWDEISPALIELNSVFGSQINPDATLILATVFPKPGKVTVTSAVESVVG